jgi:hypothetical protein
MRGLFCREQGAHANLTDEFAGAVTISGLEHVHSDGVLYRCAERDLVV